MSRRCAGQQSHDYIPVHIAIETEQRFALKVGQCVDKKMEAAVI